MNDNDFKKLLYKQLEEDKKNQGILTNQLYKKPNKIKNEKPNKKTPR